MRIPEDIDTEVNKKGYYSNNREKIEIPKSIEIDSLLAVNTHTSELNVLVEEEVLIEEEIEVVIEQPKRSLRDIYYSYVGIREATGKNDGPEVKKMLNHVGKPEGLPYCSAFVAYCLSQAGINHTVNAWSPTAVNRNNMVYSKSNFIKEPREGDVFSIYFPRLKRVAHVGFFDKKQGKSIKTVEGNTNAQGSREGNGFWVRYRPIGTIHNISRWE